MAPAPCEEQLGWFGFLTNAVGGHEEPRRARQHLEVLLLGSVNNQADPCDLRRHREREEMKEKVKDQDCFIVITPPCSFVLWHL